MKCLEFKRLALSEPNSADAAYREHIEKCPDCLKYLGGVRQMDVELAKSLDVKMPSDLLARLLLNQEFADEPTEPSQTRRYALVASFVVAVFIGGFLLSNQLTLEKQIGEDYQRLLAGALQHMNQQPITPVWDPQRANQAVNTLLSNYEPGLKFRNMNNLQFGRICPMGEYRGLHASLETDDGQITFVYIKGEAVGEIVDAAYQGYITRVKPMRGGNLLIFSRSQKSMDQANRDLDAAMYWDI